MPFVRSSFAFSIALGLGISAAAPSALAQQPDKASSAHFAEGQRLMQQGKYAEACPAFEKALALNPGAGTKFNLAECYEKTGRPSKALALYREVESVTRQVAQNERSAIAKQRADTLEPRVPTVVVRAPWVASFPRAAITLDGRAITLNDLEKPIRVDMGDHSAAARFENGKETRVQARIAAEGETQTLVLTLPDGMTDPAASPPSQGPVASAPTAPTIVTTERPHSDTQRVLGLVAGGAGIVMIGVGSAVALSAKSSYDDATATCGTACPHDQTESANDARSRANVGGGILIAGLVVLGGGATLFLTAPSSPPKGASIKLAPGADRADIGLSAVGRF